MAATDQPPPASTDRANAPADAPAARPVASATDQGVHAATTAAEPQRVETGASASPIAKLVVLISVDGLRPDVVFPHAPNMHRLAVEGASAIHSRTISKATTLPSHASMVSGVDVDQHGLGFNSYRPERGHIRYPTIFSEAQRAGLATALFVGKRKLAHLLNPETATHFEVGGVFCHKVTELAIPHLSTAPPGVVFVHMSDPDGAGHQYGWMSPKYLKAVKRADRCVGNIMRALRARGDMAQTLVVVTSDHGGHDHNHGSRHRVDRNIPWMVYGAGVKARARVRGTVYNIDTAATIFHALGLAPPKDIAGHPVLAAFAGPETAGG